MEDEKSVAKEQVKKEPEKAEASSKHLTTTIGDQATKETDSEATLKKERSIPQVIEEKKDEKPPLSKRLSPRTKRKDSLTVPSFAPKKFGPKDRARLRSIATERGDKLSKFLRTIKTAEGRRSFSRGDLPRLSPEESNLARPNSDSSGTERKFEAKERVPRASSEGSGTSKTEKTRSPRLKMRPPRSERPESMPIKTLKERKPKPRHASTDPVMAISVDSTATSGSGTPLDLTLDRTANHIRTKSFSKLETIDDEHAEFELTWCMLHGLQHFVERKKREKLLSKKHFSQHFTMKFVTKGQENKFGKWPSRLGSFTFKDYAPRVFQEIRRLSGIDKKEYIESVCYNNYIEFISNSKSGAFFFFSNDTRYMIKTIESAEEKCLLKMLESYYLHLRANPDSLIARIYGLHRVKFSRPIAGRKKFHFVVMQSVFYTKNYIHAIFDLKGSVVGRKATEKDFKRSPTDKMTGTVLKDNDLKDSNLKLNVGELKAEALREQLRLDAEFLAEQKIVDYSLLVGIHYPDLPDPRTQMDEQIASPSKNNFGLNVNLDNTKQKNGVPSPNFHTRHRRINTWSQSNSNLANNLITFKEEPHAEGKSPTHSIIASPKQSVDRSRLGRVRTGSGGGGGGGGGGGSNTGLKAASAVNRKATRSFSGLRDRIETTVGMASQNERKEVYYLGIIDILVQFGLYKRGE
eukprot:CAMPEP_0167765142 /NCGR_PEP_ID=MMETSP0110_2-20121227/14497_1 /TAXON_ID=629695 /ORGANISM="Gymnochlora sp., Strain CCMP2014" /LENGTH=689 /DNA_ID=CAMNT_0007652771 /DNA_START=121 /DNA_END=2190 /DNA_ORIENTATION=+